VGYEEKRAWIMVVVPAVAYASYVSVVLAQAGNTRLADVPYVATLLWTAGTAVAATMLLTIVARMLAPQDIEKRVPRDREINRLGDYIGQSFVAIGAVAALALALVGADHFWIANVVYLMFALSTATGATAKIFAFRRGFQSW
jgi:hypothetical protein